MNTSASTPALASTLEPRVTELEIKISFMEDLIDQLDRVIIGQQGQIDALHREMLALRTQAASSEGSGTRNLRDELPPHY